MLSKNILFEQYLIKSKKFSKSFKINLKSTEKAFKNLVYDLKNNNVHLLKIYNKNHKTFFSKKITKKFSRYKNIVVIGMGGSILGTKSIYSFLNSKIKKKVFFFDNLDENLHINYAKLKYPKETCFIVVSKSGNTLETIANLSIISSKFTLKNNLIVISEKKDSALFKLTKKMQAEFVEHKHFIGGRYSVLSEVGMLPSYLMGLNINKFTKFLDFFKNRKLKASLVRNVSNIYTLSKHGFKNSVIFNYDSGLNDFGYWYQQLVAESLGKRGKGITPIVSFAPKDHHSLLQLFLDGPKDKFFTFFNSNVSHQQYKITRTPLIKGMDFIKNKKLEFLLGAQCSATKKIFKSNKIPFRSFYFFRKSEEELGLMFGFFVLEVVLLGKLMKINPFNQPAVEQIKTATKKILSR